MQNIITKTGDNGTTKTFTGERISKGDISIQLLGYGDLLNVWIGRALHSLEPDLNIQIQKSISTIMAAIGTLPFYGEKTFDDHSSMQFSLPETSIQYLEDAANKYRQLLSHYKMTDWLIYEGNDAQLASKYCRIFESHFINFIKPYCVNGRFKYEKIYLNRLSDVLFYIGFHIQINKQ